MVIFGESRSSCASNGSKQGSGTGNEIVSSPRLSTKVRDVKYKNNPKMTPYFSEEADGDFTSCEACKAHKGMAPVWGYKKSMRYILLTVIIAVSCVASPLGDYLSSAYHARCDSPIKRQEWRALSTTQKQEYIDAVRCLQGAESRTATSEGAKTRFDDFHSAHIDLADEVHLVGQFLVWHRFYLHLYETALRKECGYSGSQPYWDWTLDVKDGLSSFAASPLFDSTYGFGGNGANIPGYNGFFNNISDLPDWEYGGPGGGCIQDGPFASYNLSLGPGTLRTNHCITRWFTPVYLKTITTKRVTELFKFDNFEGFRIELEGTPITRHSKTHDGAHFAVGGEIGDRYSSPGDPLFYLHHANLDRIWWNWQMVKPSTRLYDISGRSTVDPPYRNVTLDFMLPTKSLGPEMPIRDMMDIHNKVLCYDYA
ncbi:hypothetical protein VNI00_009935 [Paramarasmius palmivorus]|uniref:Tyrosinase copper-binding domain-containing protein n=1 Tax=Paramarasmius palmivorus TaxID=297713 RepID=A0AAW0CQ31_9AGAR